MLGRESLGTSLSALSAYFGSFRRLGILTRRFLDLTRREIDHVLGPLVQVTRAFGAFVCHARNMRREPSRFQRVLNYGKRNWPTTGFRIALGMRTPLRNRRFTRCDRASRSKDTRNPYRTDAVRSFGETGAKRRHCFQNGLGRSRELVRGGALEPHVLRPGKREGRMLGW